MVNIKKIEISAFGKFSDFELEFENGYCELIKNNEFGKSTIVDFIVFILYGYKKTASKKAGISDNLLVKYMPWNGEGVMGGALVLEKDGIIYRIERFERESGRMALTVRDASGSVIDVDKAPGEEFFGVDANTFIKTFLVRQTDMVFERTDGIVNALENLVTTGDESISFDSALRFLRQNKNKYQQGDIRKGRIFDLPKEISELENSKYALRAKLSQIEQEFEKTNQLREELKDVAEKESAAKSVYESAVVADKIRLAAKLTELNQKLDALDKTECDVLLPSESELSVISEDFSKQKIITQKLNDSTAELERLDQVYRQKTQNIPDIGIIKENEALISQIVSDKGKTNTAFLTAGILFMIAGAALLAVHIAMLSLSFIGALLTVFAFIKKIPAKIPEHIPLTRAELETQYQKFISAKNELDLYSIMKGKEEAVRSASLTELSQINARIESYREKYGITDSHSIIELQSAKANKTAIESRRALLLQTKSEILGNANEQQILGFYKMSPQTDLTAKQAESKLVAATIKKSELLSALANESALMDQKSECEREIEQVNQKIKDLSAELENALYQNDVLDIAIKALTAAHEEIGRVYSPIITQKASQPLSEFTGGKYDSVFLDKDFKIRIKSGGSLYELDYFSKGTADAVYFALRHAMSEIISQGEGLPIIMDDPFWALDSERLENARAFLKELSKQKQIIVLSAR